MKMTQTTTRPTASNPWDSDPYARIKLLPGHSCWNCGGHYIQRALGGQAAASSSGYQCQDCGTYPAAFKVSGAISRQQERTEELFVSHVMGA